MTLKKHSFNIAIELGPDSEPPTNVRILAGGSTDTSKGAYHINDGGEAILSAHREHGRELIPFDYDHAMIKRSGPDSIAAGWFTLDVRDNGDTYAKDIEWTPRAAEALRAREFRYFSPALMLDQDGLVKALVNVALTNLPATRSAVPLVAHDDGHPNPEQKAEKTSMNILLQTLGAADEAQAVTIVTEFNAVSASLLKATGTKSLDELTAAVTALSLLPAKVASLEAAETKRVADIAAAEVDRAKALLITELSDSGKLTPSLFAWAETQSIESLAAFGAAAVPVVAATTKTPGSPVAGALTPRQIQMGLTPEEAALADKGGQ